MTKIKFTQSALTKFFSSELGFNDNRPIWDSETRGLGAYRNGSGSCTLFVQYRLANGKQKKKALGRLGEVAITEARTKAVEYALAGRHGRDIAAEQKIIKRPALTLGESYLAYVEALERRKASVNTLKLNARNWRAYLSFYKSRDLVSITKRDVREWHSKWGKNGPTLANQVARLLRAIYNYAAKYTDDLPVNPCSGIEYFQEKKERPIVPTADLMDWWESVERIPNPVRKAYWKLLLFTGLRKEDAATMKWTDVKAEVIHRPNPKGGRTKAFDVPLTEPLRTILNDAMAACNALYPGSAYVFPSNGKSGRLSNTREEKYIPNCSPHALRRTYATACVEAGVDPYVIKLLLNHAAEKNDVTSRYIRISTELRASSAEKVALYIAQKTGFKNIS